MFAGYLCATQVDGRIEFDDSPLRAESPIVVAVIHGGASSARRQQSNVRVIVRDPATRRQTAHDIDPRHIVRVSNPALMLLTDADSPDRRSQRDSHRA